MDSGILNIRCSLKTIDLKSPILAY